MPAAYIVIIAAIAVYVDAQPTDDWREPVLVIAPTPGTAGIVRGEDVRAPTTWPWQAFIELNNGSNQCGGSLIADQWILTAAHCFDGGKQVTKIVMGTVSKSDTKPPAVIRTADIVCCHQQYDTTTLDYDICLIKLKNAQPATLYVRPVLLPSPGSTVADGTTCHITGWGYNEKFVLPDILQEATVKMVARQTCIDWHKPQGTVVVNNTVCAGHEKGGADSCGGDSGGPLVCTIPSQGHEFVLQGITSYGPSYCGAAKSPGIYTKVSAYIEWIQDTMKRPCIKTQWSPWAGDCSVTCGIGMQKRKRVCLDKDGKTVSADLCDGVAEKGGLCIQKPCPTFKWSDWKQGTCSSTCGDAVRTDERSCRDAVGATVDSGMCSGESTRTVACSLPRCPTFKWSDWKQGTCSSTCGDAVRTEERSCRDEVGTMVDSGMCSGDSARTVNCSLPRCPIPHFWGAWTSICSVTCGDGMQTRTRRCMNNQGQATDQISMCSPGSDTEVNTCQLPACLGVSWGPWEPWSACISTKISSCFGVSYSSRTCSITGNILLQEFCLGASHRSRNCLSQPCGPFESRFQEIWLQQ